jgi:hypothetical protein
MVTFLDRKSFDTAPLACPRCDWRGTGAEAQTSHRPPWGRTEVYCPRCSIAEDHPNGGIGVENLEPLCVVGTAPMAPDYRPQGPALGNPYLTRHEMGVWSGPPHGPAPGVKELRAHLHNAKCVAGYGAHVVHTPQGWIVTFRGEEIARSADYFVATARAHWELTYRFDGPVACLNGWSEPRPVKRAN